MHSVIDALALGRHWLFWSFGFNIEGGGGGGLKDFGDKGDHKWWIPKNAGVM